MSRFFQIVVLIPIAVVLVALAVANREAVRIALDPFDPVNTPYAVTVPLFAVVFLALILGVVAGGVAVWLRQGRYRRAARHERAAAARWRSEAERGRAGLVDSDRRGLPSPDRRTAA